MDAIEPTADDPIGAYIDAAPERARDALRKLRAAALEELPRATERIGFAMPSYYLGTRGAFHFAAFAKHIGIFAGADALEAFADELRGYRCGRGGFQVPYGTEPPMDLVRRMLRWKAEGNG